MLQAVITGPRQAILEEVPTPRPVEDLALIKILAAPMCNEYKQWLAGQPARSLGHEAAGEVVEVARPGRVKPGDRVVVMPQRACGRCALCRAGDYIHCQSPRNLERLTGSPYGTATFAQYLLQADWLLLPVPEELPLEVAALANCALGPSFGAFDRLGLTADDRLVVCGLGPVGLGAVANAVLSGVRVIGVENQPWRVAKALELGATAVLDPRDEATGARLRELCDGLGPTVGLDCSGSPAAHRLLLDALRRRGRLAFVGECSEETVLRVSPDLIRKGLTLIGSWHYNLNLADRLLRRLVDHPELARLISHTFPLTAVQDAFATVAEQATAKVILRPFEGLP